MTAAPRTFAAAIVLALAVGLAGCADTASTTSGPSLADTKSPVQLLRNEAADRIPAGVVAEVRNGNDGSHACEALADDPDGKLRSWRSDVSIVLTPESELELVVSKLLISFTTDGWEKSASSTSTSFEFTREGSAADVAVTTTPASGGTGAVILVDVEGPCVMTAGQGSDEVRKLESSAN